MKNIVLISFLVFFLFSCTSYNESKNLNTKQAQLVYSEFSNLNNDLSYQDFKSLIVEYGKNSKFPDIK